MIPSIYHRPLIASLCSSVLILSPIHSLSAQDHASSLDFGDNTAEYASDGECDDARFIGNGMSDVLLTDSIGKDSADCKAAFDAKTITLNRLHVIPDDNTPIIFGDNTSEFANDGECDDIRFAGKDADEMIFIFDDIGHDGDDCKTAFEAGYVKWQGDTATPQRGISAQDILKQLETTEDLEALEALIKATTVT